jgi:hypothetical protein
MKAIDSRLRRLEARLGAVVEKEETRQLRARLEAARSRCGLAAPSPERLAQFEEHECTGDSECGQKAPELRQSRGNTRSSRETLSVAPPNRFG